MASLQPGKADLIIAASEANHIIAVYAGTGKVLYNRKLAPAMVSSKLPCGNIGPSYGITGAQPSAAIDWRCLLQLRIQGVFARVCNLSGPGVHHAGTPIIDAASNSLFVAAMSTPDGGNTVRQLIWRVDVYTGKVAWVVDVASSEWCLPPGSCDDGGDILLHSVH